MKSIMPDRIGASAAKEPTRCDRRAALAVVVRGAAAALILGCGGCDAGTNVSEPATAVFVESPAHDFGVVEPGQLLQHVFEIRNLSSRALAIMAARPSCGCVSIELDPQSQLAAGDRGRLMLTIRPGATEAGTIISEGVFISFRDAHAASSEEAGERVLFEVSATVEGLSVVSALVVRPDSRYPLPLVADCRLVCRTPPSQFRLVGIETDIDGLVCTDLSATIGEFSSQRDCYIAELKVPLLLQRSLESQKGSLTIRCELEGQPVSVPVEVFIL